MGVLRSCYQSQAVFWPGGPALPIQWYWCPPGFKDYPYNHRFGSSVWDSDKPLDPDVGELGSAKRVYSKGALPGSVTGQMFCGHPSDFEGFGKPGAATFTGGIRDCCVSPGHAVGCCPGVFLGDTVTFTFTFPPVGFTICGCVIGKSGTATWDPVSSRFVGTVAVCGTTLQVVLDPAACSIQVSAADRPVTNHPTTLTKCSPFRLQELCFMPCPTIFDALAAFTIDLFG
jgi:hypothetical protein